MSASDDAASRDRDAAIGALRSDLEQILSRLDQLGLSKAGAYLSMSIYSLADGPPRGLLRDSAADTPYTP